MRIAVYGWVDPAKGSGETSSYLLLEDMLRFPGLSVTHYCPQHMADLSALACSGDYRQVRYGLPPRSRRLDRLVGTGMASNAWDRTLRVPRQHHALQVLSGQHHEQAPYDVTLSLGVADRLELPAVPAVWWPQGPPGVEARAFFDTAPQHRQWMTPWRYYALGGYQALRQLHASDPPSRDSGVVVVSQSHWGARRWREAGCERVEVVNFAIDLTSLCVPERPSAEPRFVHLGRLDPRKQVALLADAFELVRAELPAATLDLYGIVGYAPEITARLAGRSGVVFHGPKPRAEASEALRRHAVLVQTSVGETLGTAVPEALACGLTVVLGPDNGGADYLDPQSVVFEEYTPASVAAGMVLAYRRRAADVGTAARDARVAAERHFDRGQACAAMLRLLEEAVTLR